MNVILYILWNNVVVNNLKKFILRRIIKKQYYYGRLTYYIILMNYPVTVKNNGKTCSLVYMKRQLS